MTMSYAITLCGGGNCCNKKGGVELLGVQKEQAAE